MNSNSFLVIGDLNIDIIHVLKESVLHITSEYEYIVDNTNLRLGGSGGIVANTLAHLSNSNYVGLCSTIGNDHYGELLLNFLDSKVELRLVHVSEKGHTGVSNYYVSQLGGKALFTSLGLTTHLETSNICITDWDYIHICGLHTILHNIDKLTEVLSFPEGHTPILTVNLNGIINELVSSQIRLFFSHISPNILFFNLSEFEIFRTVIGSDFSFEGIHIVTCSIHGCVIIQSDCYLAVKYYIDGTINHLNSIGAGDRLIAHVLSTIGQNLAIQHIKDIVIDFSTTSNISPKLLVKCNSSFFNSFEATIRYIYEG